MGCTQSRDADSLPSTHPTNSRITATKIAPATKANVEYDTSSSATYAGVDSGANSYFGLFANIDSNNATQEELDRSKYSRVNLAVCPRDDSAAKDSDNLVLLRGIAMTVPYIIMVSASSASDESPIDSAIQNVFSLVDGHFNNWNPKSEVALLSQLGGGKSKEMSDEFARILKVVDQLHKHTDGRFDPTVGQVLKTQRGYLVKHGRPATPEDVSHLAHAVGWTTKIKRNGRKMTILNSNTEIDLGGVAKGYAVDLLVQTLQKMGYSDFYVDWGADIRAQGKHPSGRNWRTALLDVPELAKVFALWKQDKLMQVLSDQDALYLCDLTDVAIATSGDYFAIEKFGYHHIVHPSSLSQLRASKTSVGSVSILAPTCAEADAIATAAMTHNTATDCATWLLNLKDRELVKGFCVVGRDGKRIVNVATGITEISQSAAPEEAQGAAENVEDKSPAADVSACHKTWPKVYVAAGLPVDGEDSLDIALTSSVATLSLKPPMMSLGVTSVELGPKIRHNSRMVLAWLSQDDKDALDYLLFAPMMRVQRGSFERSHTRMEGVVEKVSSEGECFLVQLKVESVVSYNSTQLLGIGEEDHTVSIQPTPGETSLEAKLRSTLRVMPSPLSIVSLRQSDGTMFGMTATSFRFVDVAHGLVSFNVQSESLFAMAMEQYDTLLVNLPLGADGNGPAVVDRFKKNPELTATDASFCEESLSPLPAFIDCTVLKCSVLRQDSVSDHILVLARVDEILLEKHGAPLVTSEGRVAALQL